MKRLIAKSLSNISMLCKPKNNIGLRVLNYHSVGSNALQDKKGYFSISSKLFREQIKFLSTNYYENLISLENIKIPNNKLSIGITFDDGYLDNLKVAAPILLKYSIPITLFVSTNFIKNRVKNFLSPQDLKEFSKCSGFNIGSHGASHIDLTSCNNDKQLIEMIDSQNYLEDLLGKKINSFAYPYGKVNDHVQKNILKTSYKNAYTTKFYINTINSNPFKLSRFNIESDNSLKIFKQKIVGAWDWYRFRDQLYEK